MTDRILVINPNSSVSVTDDISAALDSLRMHGGPEIDCVTLEQGPPAVESQADVESVVEPLCALVRRAGHEIGAVVIACYSDPGLHAVRELATCPVFGIAESAMLTALTRGEQFGVISILAQSLPRHLRQVRVTGLEARFAGDLALGLGVLELGAGDGVLARLVQTGQRLRDECGADVVIMGCAGMAPYRARLEEALGIPVVEPTQSAVTLAIGAVRSISNVAG